MATRFITVSIDIMHDKNLTASQKFILAEIEQLSQLDKGCYAHNQHFADLVCLAKESVSRSIKDLEIKGYISVKITNGSRNHERLLTLNKMLSPPKQNIKPPLTKSQETKENKTTNRTINIHAGLNFEAFNMWCTHKGSKYSKQGKTLSRNKLLEFDKQTQMEMVENSIMNNYAGLFVVTKKIAYQGKEPQVNSLEWKRQQSLKQQEETIDAELIQTS